MVFERGNNLMQIRKISDDAIFEAYKRIKSGESLTTVSKDYGVNRGTLRKYIDEVVKPTLNEEEKVEFDRIMKGNFKGNSTEEKRKHRNGKKGGQEEKERIEEQLKILADYGVTPKQIEDLYERLAEKKNTKYRKDTFCFKLVEHIRVLTQIGLSVQDIFTIFYQRPTLFSGPSFKIELMYTTLLGKYGNAEAARRALVERPWNDLRDGPSGNSRKNDGNGYGGVEH